MFDVYITNKKRENGDLAEVEDVVPLEWIDAESKQLYWPTRQEHRFMSEHTSPKTGGVEWISFRVIKIQITSGTNNLLNRTWN